MATYFDGNRQIISVDTSVSAERFLDILVRVVAVGDVMILWARPTQTFCLWVLGAYVFGVLLSLMEFIPTQNIGFASYLFRVSDVGKQVLGWSVFITAVTLILATAFWALEQGRRLTKR